MSEVFNFSMDSSQIEKFERWAKLQDNKVAKLQNKKFAYYGASGGGYIFEFSPSGIGTSIYVRNSITKDTIDLSEYHNW